MAEALVVVGYIASIVQLIDFCGKCVSKSVELYQSSSGILDENAAVELAVKYLESLRGEVEAGAVSAPDPSLQELCTAVSKASADLLQALAKLKVQGNKTRWKSIRKALKSVWSKEEIRDLEHRLSNFREELNLHITVRTRQQLEGLGDNIETHFKDYDARQQAIIDAILHQRDLFAIALQDQQVFIQAVAKDITHESKEGHEITRTEVRREASKLTTSNQDEHDRTRQEIRSEGERAAIRGQESSNVVTQRIESTEVEILDAIDATSQATLVEHCNTQVQIDELKVALRELSQQLDSRNQELKDLIMELNKSKSNEKRKLLTERSNAVTAAILAIETMYRSLKAVLDMLRTHAQEMIGRAQSSSFKAVTRYTRRFTVSTTSDDNGNIARQTTCNLSLGKDLVQRNPPIVKKHNPYAGHDTYFGYFYRSAYNHRGYINARAMERGWEFRKELHFDKDSSLHMERFVIDESPCDSACLWLLASVTAALEIHLLPEHAALTLLANTFDDSRQRFRYEPNSNTHLRGRLEADLRYWSTFASMRGMKDGARRDRFDLQLLPEEQKDDIRRLLRVLVGEPCPGDPRNRVVVHTESPAIPIARTLSDMGAHITLTERKKSMDRLTPDIVEIVANSLFP